MATVRFTQDSNMDAKEQTENQVINNIKSELVVSAAESVDVGLIFAFKEFLEAFLEGLGHIILFPLAAGAALIRAALAWREAKLGGYQEKGAIVRAVVETLAAVLITTAVVGTLAAAVTFAVAGPIIFTATLAAKAAYHLGAAIYYGYQALISSNPRDQEKYREKMKANIVATVLNTLATVACGIVLIGHQLSFGVLGIIGGALGAGYAIYKACTLKAKQPGMEGEVTSENIHGEDEAHEEQKVRLLNKKSSTAEVSEKLEQTPDGLAHNAIEQAMAELKLENERKQQQEKENKVLADQRRLKQLEELIEEKRKSINECFESLVDSNILSESESAQDSWHRYHWDQQYNYHKTLNINNPHWSDLETKLLPYDNNPIVKKLYDLVDEHNEIIKNVENQELLSDECTRVQRAESINESEDSPKDIDKDIGRALTWQTSQNSNSSSFR